MSDSEDSFESADEGANEEGSKEKSHKKESGHSKQGKEPKHTEAANIIKEAKEAKNEAGDNKSDQVEKGEDLNEEGIIKETDNLSLTVTRTDETVETNTDSTKQAGLKDQPNKSDTKVTQEKESDPGSNVESVTKESTSEEEIEKDSSKEKGAKSQQPINALDRLAEDQKKSAWGWGGWGSSAGSWGTSLLQTATSSVSTFTSSVGEGFTNVMETVESTLGAPDPKELAECDVKDGEQVEKNDETQTQVGNSNTEEEQVDPTKGPQGQNISRDPSDPHVLVDDSEEKAGWFSTLGVTALTGAVKHTVQQTSSLVQEKSRGIVHGSLDVLETLGKKTYDVIAEGDHGLKKTFEKAKEKPNLSMLLREAAEEADDAAKREEEFVESRKSHFGAQFDDFQGLVQLEALEMLSNQCEGKLHNLLGALTTEQLATVKPQLMAIKESFELGDLEDEEDDDHNLSELVTEYTGKLALNITAAKLIEVHEKARQWLTECSMKQKEPSTCDYKAKDINEKAIQSLAEVTARTVEHFHRLGQLLLIKPQGPVTGYKDKAEAIASLTKCMCSEVSILSTKFTQCLNTVGESDEVVDPVNDLITNVYLEAGNSSNYIQNAFQLLLPVLQQATTEASTTS